jgi:CheY-like chemotaxis protein
MTEAAIADPAPNVPTPNPVPGSHLNILILDDNEFDRRRIARLANQIGIDLHVDNISGLQDLPATLDKTRFDIAFVDYRLAEGDGLDALRTIRTHPANASTAVIMVAGEPLTDVIIRAVKGGCDDFIDKEDLSPEFLRDAVHKALTRSLDRINSGFDDDLHSATTEILDGLAESCFNQMRPVLSRMLRDVRHLRRANHFEANDYENARLSRIEASCMSLWRFLAEMDAYRESWSQRTH